MNRGEIYQVDLGKTVGAEIFKTRPCVIISEMIANTYGKLIIIAPITSYKGKKLFPCDVLIKSSETGLPEDSIVKCNQIRTVDKIRLIKKMGEISELRMKDVDIALMFSLDLDYS